MPTRGEYRVQIETLLGLKECAWTQIRDGRAII